MSSGGPCTTPVGVAVVGAGYWGPNLIRNFSAAEEVDLRAVCDLDVERARKVVGRYSTIRTTDDFDSILDDDSIEAVAIATPAGTHATIGLAALEAGKHVLIEKPLASSIADATKLVERAEDLDRTLMCDHTYCYTPAVRKIRALVHGGELGELHYLDSVRVNLGLVQSDIDVVWDLAPHDLSILDFVLPEDCRPGAVSAHGSDPIGAGQACVAYLTLPLCNGALAHTHVNWLSPTKIRQFIIGGSRKMLVWDDLNPQQRITMYDTGVGIESPSADSALDERRRKLVSYRTGDLVAPALGEGEALRGVVREFAGSIRERRAPLTDGRSGLRVLELLTAASASMDANGTMIAVGGDGGY